MIQLVPFTLNDYVNFEDWIVNEKELTQFGGKIFSYPITKSQIKGYPTDINRIPFKVVLNKKPIGHAEITIEHTSNIRKAKLCRILVGDKHLRGKGLGQIIIHKLLVVAFDDIKVESVYLNVYDWNINAIKCYEKVGLVIVPDTFKTTKIGTEVWKSVQMYIDKDTFSDKKWG